MVLEAFLYHDEERGEADKDRRVEDGAKARGGGRGVDGVGDGDEGGVERQETGLGGTSNKTTKLYHR